MYMGITQRADPIESIGAGTCVKRRKCIDTKNMTAHMP